ncbi:MAG: NAD(P)-binding domain-containing protein [Lewinellaceae bacterium]|jgi:predicted dinucleotide-binding enzyme|nr:NAD(P)-binding domain-containing protein [Lewinellaceae bacterium]
MKIAVLGTGMVGKTIGSALIKLGHEVRMGSRSKGNEKALAWVASNGANASEGTFADAAGFGDLVFVATKGEATLDALNAAGAERLAGKVLVDISNPLDFSKGMPPSLFICNTDSLGDITTARGTEMLLPLWVRTWAATGNGHFSFKVVR